ncbi:cobalamin biosynthesis bifunctional protein CbiET, partial [Streptococcus dysgalactiae]
MPAEKETHAAPAWLAIVGIGEDGVAGLGDEAKRLIADAEFVFGGKRHFDLAGTLVTGEMHEWPSPFDPEMEAVLDRAGRRVCVLASGDPFFHGVGVTLARKVAAADMVVVPAPSSLSLAAS